LEEALKTIPTSKSKNGKSGESNSVLMMKVMMIHTEQNLYKPMTVTMKHTDLKKAKMLKVKSLKTRWKKYDNECSIYFLSI
jgi:hypothetical protein